ncbi:MAG: hypothetical protein ABSF65_02145 [Candidatus Bathyarchaeia archaeon]|jgi:Arc/MetJ-type ribon-helix-helix transcriptional regulator
MKTVTVRMRVEPEFKTSLENAVKEGKAKSISELMRKATNQFLAGDCQPIPA